MTRTFVDLLFLKDLERLFRWGSVSATVLPYLLVNYNLSKCYPSVSQAARMFFIPGTKEITTGAICAKVTVGGKVLHLNKNVILI